jgi:ribonuclease VapC
MIVDTSALMAIILGEDERPLFADLIVADPAVAMSVVSPVETTIELRARRRDADVARLDDLLATLRIEVCDVDLQQGIVASEAFTRFGRGRNTARLNFGDCFVYALARSREDPLLFKGDDFRKTDLMAAWRP